MYCIIFIPHTHIWHDQGLGADLFHFRAIFQSGWRRKQYPPPFTDLNSNGDKAESNPQSFPETFQSGVLTFVL